MKKLFLLPIIAFVLLLMGTTLISAAAPIGNYLVLNGGYVKTTSEDPTSPPGFTFEAWIKPNSVSGVQKILSIGDKNGQILHFEIGINGGTLSFSYNHGLGGFVSITAGQIAANQWNHIAVSVVRHTTKLFINGSAVFSPVITIGQLLQIGPDIVLGNSYLEPLSSSQRYKGAIDEVRISTIARDVVSLWNSGIYNNSLPLDQDTAVLWHLDDSRGNLIAPDSSAQQSDGLLIGGDSLIHFFGVLPTPTPFTFTPIRWNRPVLPTLSWPYPTRPTPTTTQPPPENPTPTTSSIRSFPRRTF